MKPTRTDTQSAFRALPSVDEVLRLTGVRALATRVDAALLAAFVAQVVDGWRAEIRDGLLSADELAVRLMQNVHVRAVESLVAREERAGVRRCVNATGVVLNTGLGRAPVHHEAAAAMAEAAASYCVLEVDRESGERNQRDARLAELVSRLTGAEAAIAVNNNAAAVFLVLQTFAAGKEAIVSRGELVEIGGSFRVPDVMKRANARLVEVGTTNRTRLSDYAAAIVTSTGLLMKVHTSNFRVVGFTEEVSPAELAELGRARNVPTAFDLGSGLLECDGAPPLAERLGGEPLVRSAVQSDVDVVTFSADKLLGAPQAGVIVGKRAAVRALRDNPIYRALRLDKVALAGLEKTCELLLAGRGGEIPARAMLALSAQDLEPAARALAAAVSRIDGYAADVVPGRSEPGSGSAPGVFLPTFVARVRHRALRASALAAALRRASVPAFVRVHEDAVLCDPRTLLAGDAELLVRAFAEAAGS
ncbi:MAG: L-seryl-tRNA(Sec) selenium transferase [Planctomycetota bacterium]